jgi:hypothetical protein
LHERSRLGTPALSFSLHLSALQPSRTNTRARIATPNTPPPPPRRLQHIAPVSRWQTCEVTLTARVGTASSMACTFRRGMRRVRASCACAALPPRTRESRSNRKYKTIRANTTNKRKNTRAGATRVSAHPRAARVRGAGARYTAEDKALTTYHLRAPDRMRVRSISSLSRFQATDRSSAGWAWRRDDASFSSFCTTAHRQTQHTHTSETHGNAVSAWRQVHTHTNF